MERSARDPSLFLSVGMLALFLAGSLLLVIFAAGSCRDVVDSQYTAMDERALTAYITSGVKANDTLDAVSVEDSAYGQVLVVADASTGYALRYYLYNGELVEDLAKTGSPLAPEQALSIAPTETFSVTRSGELLYVTTDAGRTLIDVRSAREGTP